MTVARRRYPLWVGPALLGAVLVNVGLFSLVTLLSGDRVPARDEISAASINLVSLKPPTPPEQEKIEKPKPPEPKQEVDFHPDLTPPALDLGAPGLAGGIEINLGLDRLGTDLSANVVFDAFELDSHPEAILRMRPDWPYRAQQRGIEGVVQVKLLVNKDGSVGEVIILNAQPEGVFEESVRKKVPLWKFRPGQIAGETVASWVVTNIRFEFE
jgi:periplasmic protein TonB